MEQVKKIKIAPLMKRFIACIRFDNGNVDTFVRVSDDGENEFAHPVTQAMWLGYKMGQKDARRSEPGWWVIAKVTDQGFEFSKTPKGHWTVSSALGELKRLEKCRPYAGMETGEARFVALSIPKAAYLSLVKRYQGNPNISFYNGEISGIPFLLREKTPASNTVVYEMNKDCRNAI